MNILVTGGAGYIGSHTVLDLKAAGFNPVIFDNFTNSQKETIAKLNRLSRDGEIPYYEADLRDGKALKIAFETYNFKTVIHFAGLKAVGESVSHPYDYYENNIGSTLQLIKSMLEFGCFNLVFSSSATVYGSPKYLPIDENHSLSATNPYGRTKLYLEQILSDIAASDQRWHIALLRYFNPVGAHKSGTIGESPNAPPNNLFPCITQYLTGERDSLSVYGTDYETEDGSGVRDYLHVQDLSKGHVSAVKNIHKLKGAVPINLGTGQGYSVLEIIEKFRQITQRSIPFQIADRRDGDIDKCFADPTRAELLLDWKPDYDLTSMVEDSWRYELSNSQKSNC